MTSLDLNAVYEGLEQFDGSIGKIHFVKKPDFRLLETIADQSVGKDAITLAFDQAFPLGNVGDIAAKNWSHQIKSACLRSDDFEDESHVWFEYSRMKRLTVLAQLPNEPTHDESENLMAFQQAVSEGMPKLKELRVVLNCNEEALQRAKSALNWPHASFDWSVERGRLSPGGRRIKSPSGRRKSPV